MKRLILKYYTNSSCPHIPNDIQMFTKIFFYQLINILELFLEIDNYCLTSHIKKKKIDKYYYVVI